MCRACLIEEADKERMAPAAAELTGRPLIVTHPLQSSLSDAACRPSQYPTSTRQSHLAATAARPKGVRIHEAGRGRQGDTREEHHKEKET